MIYVAQLLCDKYIIFIIFIGCHSSAVWLFMDECNPDPRSTLLDNLFNDHPEHVLLGSQWIPEMSEWFTLTTDHGASFKRLEPEEYIVENVFCVPDIFYRCCKFTIPDNPPTNDKNLLTTDIFRFQLSLEKASILNTSLFQSALLNLECGGTEGNIRVSNVGIGNVHSAEVPFKCPNSEAGWYSALYDEVIYPALLCIDPSIHDFHSSGHLSVSGWLNVNSDPYSFNALHDHGTATWSVVYFVDSGASVEVNCLDTEQSESIDSLEGCQYESMQAREGCFSSSQSLLGNLLLRFQLEAFTQHHAYLAVPPTPGTLWIFPSYVPHCVMPRELRSRRSSCILSAPPTTSDGSKNFDNPCGVKSRPRVSVACNVCCMAN